MLPYRILEQHLRDTVAACLPDADPTEVVVRACPDSKFGDYQTTSLMAVSKRRELNPRQFATDIVAKLKLPDWVESTDVAGPGFLNFRLGSEIIAETLESAVRGEHLFFEKAERSKTVVVDFSSPNVAKPMHVGHIRSTILGDCLARTLRFLGHSVVTDNHIGDWGTQFGKLLQGWKQDLNRQALRKDAIGELERLYRQTNTACENDAGLLEQARQELVKLQNGDSENLAIWDEMIALSRSEFDTIYGRLNVKFDHTLGESFYNSRLKRIVSEMQSSGLAQPSDGAMVVFFEDKPELKGHPALIQKSDGASNYTTTDLATLEHRLKEWSPDEIVYVTDGRQQLHFKQLFEIFRRWKPDSGVSLAHVWFGAILGEDGKPFKTRSGDTIRLTDLLDEAEERAFSVVSEKNSNLEKEEREKVARMVGLGAIKYADLAPNRQSDYVFSWDKMLALNGNTAPYLQYAHARIRSIFRKLDVTNEFEIPKAGLVLSTPEEFDLCKHLLNFGLVVEAVISDYRPNYLCNYLFELAGFFARFYENCPVLKSAGTERATRLAVCELTGRVLKQGLGLLGIEAPERM